MKRIFDIMTDWMRRTKSREELKNRSEHLLKDIGLTRSEVEKEFGISVFSPFSPISNSRIRSGQVVSSDSHYRI